MIELFARLKQAPPISLEGQMALASMITRKELPKGYLLLEQGNVCQHFYLLEKGFARGYYNHEGKDVSLWFAFEGDILTSLYSYATGKPSYTSIEILEDSVVNGFTFGQLNDLLEKYPEFNLVGRLLAEQYFIELEERTLSFQFKTATERYYELIRKHPQILRRASLGHIASFLGVSQETLSRIRAKRE
ncbi:Crp/Fnr family transcriptional regulator [Arsenicibacter rosenii]|uniref:Cyclic nucleotide-binding protein n=1 Tax=Arsenicibacter rosenii TaxID=1750698 RepID=A0A1S2VFC3_9BACT|nr:Crp/Fnr family transcriptional regulator [Arsenicibacter rosenii]OIN57409.1 cyclic nucleotide-binding protein [Arsenicibacter rosenii]